MQRPLKHMTHIRVFGLLLLYTIAGLVSFALFVFTSNTQSFLIAIIIFMLVTIIHLILPQVRANQAADKQAYEVLRAFTNFLPDRVVILNEEGRFVDILNRLHDTGANQIDNVIGKTVQEVYTPEFAEFVIKTIRETLELNAPRIIEYNTSNRFGNLVYYEGRVVPFTDANLDERCVIWSSRDVTVRINAEKTRLDLALERNKVQFMHEFVSNMTHDFKTPLAIISTNAYIIGKTHDESQRSVRVERIQAEVKKLTQMVDDMLESARLEGETSASFEPTALQPMLKEIIHEMQSKAEQKSLNLIAKLDLASSSKVSAIPRELNRAITNLVENAIKYTPEKGAVTVRLFVKDRDAIIEVTDTGIGIDASDFDNIFTRFYRTDSGRFHTSGTGLGLAIVKMIIDRHKGQIDVESELEKGSTFRVSLPLLTESESNAIPRAVES